MSEAQAQASAAGYEVVQHDFSVWRVIRASDGAQAARDSGGKGGAEVREWRSRDIAGRFVDSLVKGQPIATMHLAWITPTETMAGQGAPPHVGAATEGTAALAGVWVTDFYKGGAAGIG